MILLTKDTPTTAHIRATARIVNGQARQVESWHIGLDAVDKATLEEAVDTLEAQIGTVLSIRVVGHARPIFKSMVEAWDVLQ